DEQRDPPTEHPPPPPPVHQRPGDRHPRPAQPIPENVHHRPHPYGQPHQPRGATIRQDRTGRGQSSSTQRGHLTLPDRSPRFQGPGHRGQPHGRHTKHHQPHTQRHGRGQPPRHQPEHDRGGDGVGQIPVTAIRPAVTQLVVGACRPVHRTGRRPQKTGHPLGHHPQRTPHRRPGLIQIRQERRAGTHRGTNERIRNMRPEQHTNSRPSQQTGRSVRHTHHEKPPRGKKGGQQDKSSRAPHPATKTPPRAAQQQQRGGTNAAPQGQGGAAPTYFFLSNGNS